MNFDEVLVKIGEFGRYQRKLYILFCLNDINTGCFMVASVFLLGVPDHRLVHSLNKFFPNTI